jgi:flavin-dependent dehydrogenase
VDYDLLAIGTGTAGTWDARTAAGPGTRTAVVEQDGFASTCPASGRIPKKVPVSCTPLLVGGDVHVGHLTVSKLVDGYDLAADVAVLIEGNQALKGVQLGRLDRLANI